MVSCKLTSVNPSRFKLILITYEFWFAVALPHWHNLHCASCNDLALTSDCEVVAFFQVDRRGFPTSPAVAERSHLVKIALSGRYFNARPWPTLCFLHNSQRLKTHVGCVSVEAPQAAWPSQEAC
jgi:hypothetical protein